MAQIPVGPGQVYAAYFAQACSPDPAGKYVAQQMLAIGQALDAQHLMLTAPAMASQPAADDAPDPAAQDEPSSMV